jgi:hypothetical protein
MAAKRIVIMGVRGGHRGAVRDSGYEGRGRGRRWAARAVTRIEGRSRRRPSPFVVRDCSTIPGRRGTRCRSPLAERPPIRGGNSRQEKDSPVSVPGGRVSLCRMDRSVLSPGNRGFDPEPAPIRRPVHGAAGTPWAGGAGRASAKPPRGDPAYQDRPSPARRGQWCGPRPLTPSSETAKATLVKDRFGIHPSATQVAASRASAVRRTGRTSHSRHGGTASILGE